MLGLDGSAVNLINCVVAYYRKLLTVDPMHVQDRLRHNMSESVRKTY
jgi:hypothetical protein